MSKIPKDQTCKENPHANSIACPVDVNNFVQTRLACGLVVKFEQVEHKNLKP